MGEGGSGADPPTQQAADEGRAGQPAMPLESPGPDRKAADLRNDAAEEERRQKLRQVCICFLTPTLWHFVKRLLVFLGRLWPARSRTATTGQNQELMRTLNVLVGDHLF